MCIAVTIFESLGEKKNGLITASYISGFFVFSYSHRLMAKHAQ